MSNQKPEAPTWIRDGHEQIYQKKEYIEAQNLWQEARQVLYQENEARCDEIRERMEFELNQAIDEYQQKQEELPEYLQFQRVVERLLSEVKETLIEVIVTSNDWIVDRIKVPKDASDKVLEETALASEKVRKELNLKPIRKVVIVPNKLVKFVV